MDQEALDLAQRAGQRLRESGWRVATAESCTGGLVGHLLTEVAGSSAYFHGGLIAYDNAVKRDVLGVASTTLQTRGAVSEECAAEMAQGARRIFGSETAIATTGIAGPGGGTPDKPVGLVFIAVATPATTRVGRYLFSADRSGNKQQTALRALEMLLHSLEDSTAG